MKRIFFYSTVACLTACFTVACDSFKDVSSVHRIEAISVRVTAESLVETIPSVEGLPIVFYNPTENYRIERTLTAGELTVNDLIPGKYNITVGGMVNDQTGLQYTLKEVWSDYAILEDGISLHFELNGAPYSPLIFKEVFYNNSRYGETETQYIFSQFYEIYNNSEEVQYLDDVYFTDLAPTTASAAVQTTLYYPGQREGISDDGMVLSEVWNRYDCILGIRVWKFPSVTGADFPLQPGESCVLVQRAQDHTAIHPDLWNYSTAEFEFWMPNTGEAYDFPAPNMEHVYVNNSSDPGSLNQYLTTAAGPALAMFRVPEGVDYDFTEITNQMHIKNASGAATTHYTKIPVGWVFEAIEAAATESLSPYKRLPGVLDGSMAIVAAANSGKSIARKMTGLKGPDGDPIYQDTNDSANDFEVMDDPQIRRYGAKMPAWNHTLANSSVEDDQ